jgi:50S ribosomal subunit-associated GTPase HflX
MSSHSDDELSDENDEWRNVNIRENLALNSICSINNVKASTFFSKGRLNEIGNYLRETDADILYVNTSLSVIQRRNMEM